MNKWLWSLLCVVLLGAAACSDDDTEEKSETPVPPTIATENLPDAGLKFLYSAQTVHTFLMSVDAPWEITKTAGWFVVTPIRGEAGKDIPVTVTAVNNEGDARDGTFTIRANSGNNLHPCLTEKTVTLVQDAYLAAGIVITGLEERPVIFDAEDPAPVTFTVNASYDWTLDAVNETWFTVVPKSGSAGVETSVTITPKASTENERHESTLTITAGDPGFGENTATEVIELVQLPYMPVDSHAEGYVFFSDDFAWITENWVAPYTKYGWPSVAIDGTNNNEFALSTDGMKEAVAAKGYTATASTYARYEGHVKLGKTANMGAITIPALSGIDAGKAATLLVQFDAAAYSSAGGTVDNGDDKIDVTITGPGTINGLLETTTLVEVKNVWNWTRYSVIVYGATAETRITFGSERTVKCRLYIDNISVTRAKDENPEAPEPEAIVTPLDKEITNTTPAALFNANGEVIPDGGTLTASIRVNRAWTAETDCDWLTITTVRCADKTPETATGANNGAALANGVATVKATGLPYVNTKVEISANAAGAARTGNIILKADGAEIEKITVTQAAPAKAQIAVTGLTDGTIPEFAADATSGTGFTVRSNQAWTIEVPAGDDWYTVSPLKGDADTDVTVTVTPKANNGGLRSGSFTIKADDTLLPITLSQAAGADAIGYAWSFPATAEADGLVSKAERWYKSDDGTARIDAIRAVDPSKQSPNMSYTLGADGEIGRLLMYGFTLDDYWMFTLPVKDFAAGTALRLNTILSSSATGAKYFLLEYSTDQTNWNPLNAKKVHDKSEKDAELREITYTCVLPDSPANADCVVDETFAIPAAVADGNIYLRLRVCDKIRADKQDSTAIANNGTTRMKAKTGICDKITVTEVQL